MPDFDLEKKIGGLVCGIDEAGRGPLAGPVVAACVYIPPEKTEYPFWQKVNDSKKVKQSLRVILDSQIREHAIYGIGIANVEEIETINILQATFRAMQRAMEQMVSSCGYNATDFTAVIDGNKCPVLTCTTIPLIKGDSKSISVAAASILAKVTRDKMMADLSLDYPVYGWDENAGYGTLAHREAIQRHGISMHHRASFCRGICAKQA